jgi:transcriptional regulator with XRE-family HTH domain
MSKSNIERKENIIRNIKYLIKSRGETKLSFAERINLTRASLYKILDGKINNVQHSTVEKVANFFGTTYDIIEDCDLEKIEIKNNSIGLSGNKNPSAIPIIPENNLINTANKSIGELTIIYPITYFFDNASNIIAISVGELLSSYFSRGSLLIVKRPPITVSDNLKIFITNSNKLITSHNESEGESRILGEILEERLP